MNSRKSKRGNFAFSFFAMLTLPLCAVAADPSSAAPETWFHIIDGNASKEGLAEDIKAISEAGISGIQFFHGGWGGKLWPGVKKPIPCLSENWVDLVKFAENECHKRGLTFKMQNCPGWSMSGGPWVKPERAMRKLVCFEPGKKPKYGKDDDFHEIATITFPLEDSSDISVIFPKPRGIDRHYPYNPDAKLSVVKNGKKLFTVECPRGPWQDLLEHMTFRSPKFKEGYDNLTFISECPRYGTRKHKGRIVKEPKLDMWEAKAGWVYREFKMSSNATPIKTKGTKTLVFGHVNAKRKNAPAPREGTGWECDKMDPRGFQANFEGYLGRLMKAGVKIDGTLVDSWECGCQTWTWNMEEEFKKRTGYSLRPFLPALFGYVLKSEAETEKFLLDWRNVCSRLVEENYFAVIARIAHEHGMSVQYETAFADVIPGDALKYWKFADEPMCEFWSPHSNKGSVGGHDYKPVLPCASAAHLYGKRRVSAEALTSFNLTFNENFKLWKGVVDKHLVRGVTHLVFHTYTHNPVIGGKPPSTSFGSRIGSPFLRLQSWWPYMKHFSKYAERCCRELERGLPVMDILLYLGDDVSFRPSERELFFGNRWKYDYLNNDVLMTRLDVKDGRFVLPYGASYRVIWIPEGTYLIPSTEAKLKEFEKKGGRVVRGAFTPDWESPLKKFLGKNASDVVGWYQRRDGETDIFFVAEKDGTSMFYRFCKGKSEMYDPVSGNVLPYPAKKEKGKITSLRVDLKSLRKYEPWVTKRIYEGEFALPEKAGKTILRLGKVCDWATVHVNGKKVADLWTNPYDCDITGYVKKGKKAKVRVEVVSTWFNRLVYDARQPAEKRKTWTIAGPGGRNRYADAGLYGPVTVSVLE